MRRFQTLIWLLFIYYLAVSVQAQKVDSKAQTLTLQQAVDRALSNYTTIEIQLKAIERARAMKTTAGLLPNPILSYYHESLSLNGAHGGEWIITGSLPLNSLWTRWSEINVANAQLEAEQLILADVQRLIKFEVEKAYIETHFAEKNLLAGRRAAKVFEQAAKTSRIRYADNDLSGYDQQRIVLEHLRYKKTVAEALIQFNNSCKKLSFLIEPELANFDYKTSAPLPTPSTEIPPLASLLERAKENRPDLMATRESIRAKCSALTANKWQGLPEITALAGYKKQLDDFKGTVYQVNVSLPIFNRNQGKIQYARAELEQQILITELLEKQVTLEVKQTYENLQVYRKQVEEFYAESSKPQEIMLETALFSYNQGEMSLIELLDGARAYSESFQTKHDLFMKYQLSIFELEKAVAAIIIKHH